jgi:hypothetical protein
MLLAQPIQVDSAKLPSRQGSFLFVMAMMEMYMFNLSRLHLPKGAQDETFTAFFFGLLADPRHGPSPFACRL